MFSTNDSLIECVPNFSEGRNQAVIDSISGTIKSILGVKLMHTDVGFDANRTVFTFAGNPEAVAEAAFQSIKIASELIDMSVQQGAHPRMGACDVCPLIPLQHISMEAVIELTKELGKRLGNLDIPVYLYENSALLNERKNLSYLRKGEYESIADKIKSPEWKPDYGPTVFNEKFGMMALGARNFLIAYNINLNSKDVTIAKNIARNIRKIRNNNDKSYLSNLFQSVKAIGWFMETFDCTQVSLNITNIENSPIIEVFTAIQKMASDEGVTTNGSELIGLIPLKAFSPISMSLDESIEYLGLNKLKPFNKEERIIEYNLFKV